MLPTKHLPRAKVYQLLYGAPQNPDEDKLTDRPGLSLQELSMQRTLRIVCTILCRHDPWSSAGYTCVEIAHTTADWLITLPHFHLVAVIHESMDGGSNGTEPRYLLQLGTDYDESTEARRLERLRSDARSAERWELRFRWRRVYLHFRKLGMGRESAENAVEAFASAPDSAELTAIKTAAGFANAVDPIELQEFMDTAQLSTSRLYTAPHTKISQWDIVKPKPSIEDYNEEEDE